MELNDLIDIIQEGQIARASYQSATWYMTKKHNRFYNCDKNGEIISETMLSYWNVKADWEIL